MLGFVFPGETAAILGGVLASKGGVTLPGILATVIVCAIVGDSVGYFVGDKWGRLVLNLAPLRKRQRGIDMALEQLRRRGATAVFLGRFTAFLRAVIPGLAGLSRMRVPHLPPGQCGRRAVLGRPLRPPRLLRRPARREGHRDRLGHSARPHPRGHRRPRHPPSPQEPARDRGARTDERQRRGEGGLSAQPGRSRTDRSPARRPASTRANSPAASSPWVSVSSQRGAAGSLRSMPKSPKLGA